MRIDRYSEATRRGSISNPVLGPGHAVLGTAVERHERGGTGPDEEDDRRVH